MEYYKIFSSEYRLHRFTDVKSVYSCLCLLNTLLPDKMIHFIWTEASISHLLIKANVVHSGFWSRAPLFLCQIPVCLYKQSDCQISRRKEFPYRDLPPPPNTGMIKISEEIWLALWCNCEKLQILFIYCLNSIMIFNIKYTLAENWAKSLSCSN